MSKVGFWATGHLSLLACLSPIFAIGLPMTPAKAQAAGCQAYTQTIYAAAGRYVRNARLEMCPNRLFDMTTGRDQALPDEEVFVSACRASARKPNAVIRAVMGKRYLLNPARPEEMELAPLSGRAGEKLANAARALPFVPTKVLNLGSYAGQTWIGYTGLTFMPGVGNDVPLSRNAVLIGLDGCGFSNPEALAAMLKTPGGKQYVELIFFEQGDPSKLYRVFAQTRSTDRVGDAWARLTRQSPQPNQFGRIAAIVSVITLAKVIIDFRNSPLGQQLIADVEYCRGRYIERTQIYAKRRQVCLGVRKHLFIAHR